MIKLLWFIIGVIIGAGLTFTAISIVICYTDDDVFDDMLDHQEQGRRKAG